MTDYSTGSLPILCLEEQGLPVQSPVRADVKFGVLQPNGDCTNVGICRIVTVQRQGYALPAKRRSCPTAAAELFLSMEGRLLIYFPKSGMLPCTERAFFRQLVFPMPVAHCLPEDVLKCLHGLKQHIIPAGLYPIRRSASGYWVAF
jgi:hypothetical protein